MTSLLPRYNAQETYDWNYAHAPPPVELDLHPMPGEWRFCGRRVDSPLGIAAGPLLNGAWCLYYASLGFDVVTYKTVRSVERACYPLPNLQPVACGSLHGGESDLPAIDEMQGSWAVSFGMPSQAPSVWRADLEKTRGLLPAHQLLSVSVVGTIQEGWTIDELAADYALCARWAVESGADCVETNFSCPNVASCDGQLYQHPHDAATVAQRVAEAVGNTPYIVKVGHVATSGELEELLTALAPWACAVAMTNSVAATIVDPQGKRMFGGQKRGICGAATFEPSLTQVQQASEVIARRGLSLEVIGVGGAARAQHVRAYLNAGASAVHLATAAMIDPAAGAKIRREWAVSFSGG
jgi:dihydroorotate dehydrogenase